ncbi:unnamed protein product [Pelagomonas calceolata]|uniref:Uncharacterized protein n=1 Tax=Pelagomonas calceolata TaxID=35677 RepID=A0A8J2SL73_9STRA|nr:unnamed protein product [Pelagomonas calceolata]
MWRLGGLLALLAATTNAQEGVPRPTRLRIYEVRTALRFDEGELQRVNFRYDRSSGIKSDIARSLVDVGLTTDRGFVFDWGRRTDANIAAPSAPESRDSSPTHLCQSFGGGTLPNLSAASRRQASGLDAGDVSSLTDDGTSSPTILNHADAIRFLERARARR